MTLNKFRLVLGMMVLGLFVVGTSCIKVYDPPVEVGGEPEKFAVLSFEDGEGSEYFGKLIDKEQSDGELLYAKAAEYGWYDDKNTFLASEFPQNYPESLSFAGGGCAISNYVGESYDGIDWTKQLEIPLKGGHNNSKNFCVVTGYNKEGGTNLLPYIYFKDGAEREMVEMYVTNTSYFLNGYLNGNAYSAAATDDDYVDLVIVGYNKDKVKTGEVKFRLGEGKNAVKEWRKVELKALGKVNRVEFNMDSSLKNEWGLTVPAYFAMDDLKVKVE